MLELFAGHEGAHGTHGTPVYDHEKNKWVIKSTARGVREGATLKMWEEHLEGKRPLGIVPIRMDSTCVWGSIDIDQYDANLLEIIVRVESQKLPLVPCRSKSGGLHLFLFLAEPVPAGQLQAVLRDWAAQLGLAGCEIFPKQTQILQDRGDMGQWMVMPYYGDTYGGKIKEQVGLRRTGAEMEVGEFLKMSEKLRQTEAQLEKTGRKKSKLKGQRLPTREGPSSSVDDFSDGPCCIQNLIGEGGIQRGGQSNALFMMGVYYKKANPEDWEVRLEAANHKFLTPPGTSEGLQTVIRSLKKKDYEYTCKNEPMVSHCNASLCRMRRFGVGDGGNFPVITQLSKLETEPPIWFVEIDSQRIEASTEQLQNYILFHRLCIDRLHKSFAILKTPDWFSLLNAAMENMIVIEAPSDVAMGGRFHEMMEEFLTNRARGQVKEDLLSGRPWEDEADHRHYFRLQDLQKFLRREDERGLTRGQITQKIRDMGGADRGLRVKEKFVNCWWVPSSAVTPTPELDPPPIATSPI